MRIEEPISHASVAVKRVRIVVDWAAIIASTYNIDFSSILILLLGISFVSSYIFLDDWDWGAES